MFKIQVGPIYKQYAVVITANLCLVCLGMNVVWASPMLVKLRDENQTVLPQPITEEQGAWVVSMAPLAGIGVIFVSGFLMDQFGRKISILLTCIPRIIMCLIFIFASDLWMILFGRGIAGFIDIYTISIVPTYSSEIASKEIRGALGTITQILSAIGSLIVLSIGPFVSYLTINIIILCVIILMSIPLLFLPESPYFLYSKGRTQESLEVLTSHRGTEELAHEEIKEYSSNINTTVDKRELLKDRTTLKTIGKTLIFTFGFQMTGFNAVFFYLQTVFESTQTNVRPEISSLVIGCIQLFACLGTFVLTDRFGRKPILTISLLGMALGMIGLGVFFKLAANSAEIIGFMNYLPLISFILVIYCYNSGMGSLFWIVVAELFDGPSRALGSSIAALVTTILWFFLTKFFPSVASSIGPAPVYWIFGTFCVLTCLFVVFCIPETKGKSFAEIQKDLGRRDSKVKTKKATYDLPKVEKI